MYSALAWEVREEGFLAIRHVFAPVPSDFGLVVSKLRTQVPLGVGNQRILCAEPCLFREPEPEPR